MAVIDRCLCGGVDDTDQALDDVTLRSMLMEKASVYWMDRTCEFTVDDVSKESITSFIEDVWKFKGIWGCIYELYIEPVLSSYGLISDGKLTVAAVILFGKPSNPLNESAYIRIEEFDVNGNMTREDKVEGPTIDIARRAFDTLYDNYIHPRSRMGRTVTTRSKVNDYPEDAIAESIVNAVVHRDYRMQEPITISIHPDRLEVCSPGELPSIMSADDLQGSHISCGRNHTLVRVFHDMGLMEVWGHGTNRVIRACIENGNRMPEFSVTDGHFTVTIHKSGCR